MINFIFQKTKLPIFAALIISLCVGFYGCKNSSASTADSASVSSRHVSSSSQVSSSQAVSAPSSKVNDAAKSSAAVSGKVQKKESQVTVTSSAQYSKYVRLTIDATKGGDGVVVSGGQVGINAGETVYAVLTRYCSQHKILLAAQKTGNGEYVSSIDGVAQFDRGSQSGWLYSVGGVFSQEDCNSYKLNGGESIKWVYTTDLGKSEEKDQ